MLHISTFSGIGGFDLAAEWMGWKNIASCEINEFGNKVLNYYWPDAYHHDDIHTFTYEKINIELEKRFGKNWRSDDIILSGGFPCQPYSTAGKRLGKDDERHLFPEMLRAIREIQPTWVVGENVSGLLSWNGGMVFDEVQADLEAAGYEVIPFILPAAGVGAPHRRDRIFFVAHRNECSAGSPRKSGSVEGNGSENNDEPKQRGEKTEQYNRPSELLQFTPNPHHTGGGTGLGQVQEANGEIPKRDNDAESGNTGDAPTIHSKWDEWDDREEWADSASSSELQLRSQLDNGGGNISERTMPEMSRVWRDGNISVPEANGNATNTDSKRQANGYAEQFTDKQRYSNRSDSENVGNSPSKGLEGHGELHEEGKEIITNSSSIFSSDSFSIGQQGQGRDAQPGDTTQSGNGQTDWANYDNERWERFPTQPPVCSRNDGLSPELVGITVSKHRQESIKGYGNAIVPQVALQIFKAIEEWEKSYK